MPLILVGRGFLIYFFLFANRDFNLFWGYGCYSNERCITYGWSCNENAFTVGGMLPCVELQFCYVKLLIRTLILYLFCRVHISCFIKTQFSLNNDYCASFCCNFYKIALIKNNTKLVDSTGSLTNDDEEEDI